MKTQRLLDLTVRVRHAKTPDEIILIAQTGGMQDLVECYALHESLELPYRERTRCVLLEMWRTLLSEGAMQIGLVRNRGKPIGSQIISFSALLFVTDEFCSKAKSELFPYVGVQLAALHPLQQLPVLNRKQIAQANTVGGLNVMICFEGRTFDSLSSEQLFAAQVKQSEALHLALSGYRLKEFLANPIGANIAQCMVDAGARLRRDYSDYFRKHHLRKPESPQWPYLLGLTKEEAFAHPGSDLSALFTYTRPRFRFNRSQRVLLRYALMGKTCGQLAASLSVSRWTVKKRWHAIYDRVADTDIDLLPPPIAQGLDASSRGTERRRPLLNYLRQHPEELRPFESLTPHAAGRSDPPGCRVPRSP